MSNRVNVYKNTTSPDEHKLYGWFNPQTAEHFKESTRWNGNNNIGVISGLQCGFEELFLTSGGLWVRHYDASGEFDGPKFYEFITPAEARDWLLRAEGEDDTIERLFGRISEEAGPTDDIYTLAELLNSLAPLVTEGLTDHPITVQYADRLIGPVTGIYTADGAIALVV